MIIYKVLKRNIYISFNNKVKKKKKKVINKEVYVSI